MSQREVNERLQHETVKVECPICRHRQWLNVTPGRCDQCGSEITVYGERGEAQEALDDLVGQGRVAYMQEPVRGLFAVIANRAFGRSEGG